MNLIVPYALRGLSHCFMPDKNRWSYIYHLDGRENPNHSRPAGDVFYSLNVLLGLSQLEEQPYNLADIFAQTTALMDGLSMPPYAYGMALWAGAEIGEKVPQNVQNYIANRGVLSRFNAQTVGMFLSGICSQKAKGCPDYDLLAHQLYHLIKKHFLTPSGLFRNSATGLRRDFASFAAQAYMIAGCYAYAKTYDSSEAYDIADNATITMMVRQGANGEWPWFYHAPSGLVVDQYEFYSVHQHGMSALFLLPAMERGLPGARPAIIKGFNWLLGNNDLQQPMLLPQLGMMYRSIARTAELESKVMRGFRSVYHCVVRTPDHHSLPEKLTLRKECRSYELGWLLYIFSKLNGQPEITGNKAFEI